MGSQRFQFNIQIHESQSSKKKLAFRSLYLSVNDLLRWLTKHIANFTKQGYFTIKIIDFKWREFRKIINNSDTCVSVLRNFKEGLHKGIVKKDVQKRERVRLLFPQKKIRHLFA